MIMKGRSSFLQRLRPFTENIQIGLIREHPMPTLAGEFVDDLLVAERGDGGMNGGRCKTLDFPCGARIRFSGKKSPLFFLTATLFMSTNSHLINTFY